MLVLRYGLLLLSLLQYIGVETFWRRNFLWFFIIIILFQVLWFLFQRQSYQKILTIAILGLLVLAAVLFPSVPLLLLLLALFEVFQHFSRQSAYRILLSLLIVSAGLRYFGLLTLTFSEILMVLGLMLLVVSLAPQLQERERLLEAAYQQQVEQDTLLKRSEILEGQMTTMREVHVLQERNRISREIHDSVGHVLSTMIIQLEAIAKLTEKDQPQVSQMSDKLRTFAKDGLAEVRQVIHNMKPDHYEKLEFIELIQQLIDNYENHSKTSVVFNYNEARWLLSEQQRAALYRAVQEFLGNTAKHAQASEIRIQLHYTNESLILTMKDNGQGTEEIHPQVGLTGLAERVNLLGGKVTHHSDVDQGFLTRVVLNKRGVTLSGLE